MSRSVDLREFIAGFLVEAEELLRAANVNLIAVDESAKKGEAHPRAVRDLFRSLHTIKGLAAMVEVEPIVAIAHGMEAVLRLADQAGGRLSLPAIEALIDGNDAIDQRVRALGGSKEVAAAPTALIEALAALEVSGAAAAPSPAAALALQPELLAKLTASEREQLAAGIKQGKRALRVDFVPSPARAAEGLTITTVRERISAIAEIVKVLPVSLPRAEGTAGGVQSPCSCSPRPRTRRSPPPRPPRRSSCCRPARAGSQPPAGAAAASRPSRAG